MAATVSVCHCLCVRVCVREPEFTAIIFIYYYNARMANKVLTERLGGEKRAKRPPPTTYANQIRLRSVSHLIA